MKKFFPAIVLMASLTLSACGTVKTDTGMVDNTNNKTEEVKTTESMSLKELLGLGTSQKCTFESKTDDTTVKSEIVMSGNKFKQMSEISDMDGTTKVYAVSDGVYYYSWSDISKEMGTKIKIEDMENESKNAPTITDQEPVKTEGNQQINMDEKVDYKCTPATLNDSDLVIPSDIKFIDYADMMKGVKDLNLDELKKMAPQE